MNEQRQAVAKAEKHGWEHCLSPVGTTILIHGAGEVDCFYIEVNELGLVSARREWNYKSY